ncbi:hypothetical protein HU200_060357 [Digitaria exilis]|uniref:Uncharacterized protein n=1 Tax=Digitaria exilis TaxID=1010633 RepID=A0A835ACC2_9POAL|nr:hypothetical protein HU200_060357 [Digitaria exilis]
MAPAGTAGGGGEEPRQEFEIRNDEGFVYKVPAGLYPEAAPSSTKAAAGPDPEVAGLRRRRRALLRLRDKRLRQLFRWEALASELLAPLPAARPPAPQSPPASPPPVSTAASDSILDDLLAQADLQAELLKKASALCGEINALCDAHEAALVDDIAALPVWGSSPRELVASFGACPDEQSADPGTSGLDEWNGSFQRLDSQQGKTVIVVSSAVVEKVEVIGDKRIQSPSQCKQCLQFGCTGETCCETHAEQGDELPPSDLTENRFVSGCRRRKGPVSPSSSKASNKRKSQKASGNAKPSGTPGPTTTRKVLSTPRAPDTSRSLGPTTRRRAAAQLLSPRSQ